MVCRKVVILNGAEGHGSTKGIVTISDEGARAAVKIDVFGLPVPNAEYVAALSVDGNTAVFRVRATGSAEFSGAEEWKVVPSSKIESAVGVNGRLIAYGANFTSTVSSVKSLIAENGEARTKEQSVPHPTVSAREIPAAKRDDAEAPQKCGIAKAPMEDEGVQNSVDKAALTDYEKSDARRRSAYDDERIADINYYPPEFETRIDRGRYVAHREAAAELDAWGGYNAVYKARLSPRAEAPKRDVPSYYLSVKETLDKLFSSAPSEMPLNKSLSPSRWVRVDYREGLYYCVGLVGASPDYIGYAVPGVYSLNPPRQMAGLCKWLPLDRDDPNGHGYWMMFQDAVTGAGVPLPRADSVG